MGLVVFDIGLPAALRIGPPEIGAVALMTDTDNTGGEAVAYYGDIFLGPAR